MKQRVRKKNKEKISETKNGTLKRYIDKALARLSKRKRGDPTT